MSKICESCGMPMRIKRDFSQEDEEARYCRFCAPNGILRSFEEVVNGMARFIQTKHPEISWEKALEQARANLRDLPAWKDKISNEL
jgi:hypothetical protein